MFSSFHHCGHHHLVHVCAGVLVQLVAAGEDDEGDLAVAQDGQLVRLLHHPELPLVERYLGLFVSEQLFAIFVLPNPITATTIATIVFFTDAIMITTTTIAVILRVFLNLSIPLVGDS